MPNICSMSNPIPISWQDVEDASAKDKVALALNKLILFKDRAVLYSTTNTTLALCACRTSSLPEKYF